MSSGLYSTEKREFDTTLDLTKLRPYGDTMNDGKVQMSFTLPVACNEKGIEAALQLARKMGFVNPAVAFSEACKASKSKNKSHLSSSSVLIKLFPISYICLNTLAALLYSLTCSTALFRRKSSLTKLIPTTATFSSLFFNSYKGSKFIFYSSLKS